MRSDVEVWRYRAMEVCCSRIDVEAWRYGALEPWRRAAGADVEVWRFGRVERWNFGGALKV